VRTRTLGRLRPTDPSARQGLAGGLAPPFWHPRRGFCRAKAHEMQALLSTCALNLGLFVHSVTLSSSGETPKLWSLAAPAPRGGRL
jgi:hypothetical protein